MAILTTALLMLVSAPAQAQDVVSPDPVFDGPYLVLGQDPNTDNIVEFRCGGNAPEVTSCDTGTHTLGGWGYILIGFDLNTIGDTYTGFAEAQLSSANGNIDFRCEWNNGDWQGCEIITFEGWPSVGMDFDYGCVSYFNTPVNLLDNLLIDNGIQGGLGDWECLLRYDD